MPNTYTCDEYVWIMRMRVRHLTSDAVRERLQHPIGQLKVILLTLQKR